MLGFNCTHTSATCTTPTDGDCTAATATNMQDGKTTIQPEDIMSLQTWGASMVSNSQPWGWGKLAVAESLKPEEPVNINAPTTYLAQALTSYPSPPTTAHHFMPCHIFSHTTPPFTTKPNNGPTSHLHNIWYHHTINIQSWPWLPAPLTTSTTCHTVPQLAMQQLLSIGQLCDAGCKIAFTGTVGHNWPQQQYHS